MAQMAEVKERTRDTYEQKEADFKAFLESQSDMKCVPLQQIVADTIGFTDELFKEIYNTLKVDNCEWREHSVREWVKYRIMHMYELQQVKGVPLENNTNLARQMIEDGIKEFIRSQYTDKLFRASFMHGYGDMMDTAEEVKVHNFGKTEMIVYKEPEYTKTTGCAGYGGVDMHNIDKLDDYTVDDMTDYRVAFQEVDMTVLKDLENKYPSCPENEDTKKLEDMIHDREELTNNSGDERARLLRNFRAQMNKLAI
jgi:uncharacterized protein YaaR (DUF327 family)